MNTNENDYSDIYVGCFAALCKLFFWICITALALTLAADISNRLRVLEGKAGMEWHSFSFNPWDKSSPWQNIPQEPKEGKK